MVTLLGVFDGHVVKTSIFTCFRHPLTARGWPGLAGLAGLTGLAGLAGLAELAELAGLAWLLWLAALADPGGPACAMFSKPANQPASQLAQTLCYAMLCSTASKPPSRPASLRKPYAMLCYVQLPTA